MSDNLAITPGAGATVAADDVGGVLHQRIKLSLGADGTAVDAVAGAGAVGTGVQRTTLASDDPAVTSLQTIDDWDSADACKTVGVSGLPSVTPGCDTAALTSGDTIFNCAEIANALRVNGGTAILQSLVIIDKDDQGAALTLYLTSDSIAFGALNSPPAITDANATKIQSIIDIATGDWKDLGGVKVAEIRGIGSVCKGNATTSLWVSGVTGGTPTYTASGIVINFGFLQD